MSFTGAASRGDEDSGSETEVENEGEGGGEGGGEGEEGREGEGGSTKEGDFEVEKTVAYGLDDSESHDEGESSAKDGPFEDCTNGATVAYDLGDLDDEESEDDKQQESKQRQDGSGDESEESECVVKSKNDPHRPTGHHGNDDTSCPVGQASSSRGVAISDDQTLAYTVDTETEEESDTDVRSKYNQTVTRNAKKKGSPAGGMGDAPSIKPDNELKAEGDLDEDPVPVATATAVTRSKQKTLVGMITERGRERGRGRGRGRGKGRVTPSQTSIRSSTRRKNEESDNATSELSPSASRPEVAMATVVLDDKSVGDGGVSSTDDGGNVDAGRAKTSGGRGRGRGRGGRKGGRKGRTVSKRAQLIADSADQSTDIASEESAPEAGGRGGVASPPPPPNTVSMVRRVIEGMTLKSEESRLRGRSRHAPSATVDMSSVESPDIGSSRVPGSHDDHVTKAEELRDPVDRSCESHVTDVTTPTLVASSPSYGAVCESRDDQSDHGSVTSSAGTPSMDRGRGRGRGKGKGRAKRVNTPRSKPVTPTLKSGGTISVLFCDIR